MKQTRSYASSKVVRIFLLAALLFVWAVCMCALSVPAFAYTNGEAPYETNKNFRFAPSDIENSDLQKLYDLKDEPLPSSFNLHDAISIPIADQQNLGLCDLFASLKCVETNYALKTGAFVDLSERYVDYMTSRYHYDTDRIPGTLDTGEDAATFATMGDGAYLPDNFLIMESVGVPTEEDVPYTDYTLQEIAEMKDATPAVRVTSSVCFPNGIPDMDEPLRQQWTDIIKTHIMRYGSVYSIVEAPDESVGNYNVETSAAYYSDEMESAGGHAISIVGWDDNYPKENFATQPSRNGAFICQNSWGKQWGKSGCYYISYDDEALLGQSVGVLDTEVAWRYNTYTHGSNLMGSAGFTIADNTRFFGTTFTVNDPTEKISHISIGVGGFSEDSYTTTVRMYVNPHNATFDKDKLVLLEETNSLVSGSRANISLQTPLPITGNEFAVVVEIDGDPDDFTFVSSMDASNNPITGNMYRTDSLNGTWEPYDEEFPVFVYTVGGQAVQSSAPKPTLPSETEGQESGGEGDLGEIGEPAYEEPETDPTQSEGELGEIGEPAYEEPETDPKETEEKIEQPSSEQPPRKDTSDSPAQSDASSSNTTASTPQQTSMAQTTNRATSSSTTTSTSVLQTSSPSKDTSTPSAAPSSSRAHLASSPTAATERASTPATGDSVPVKQVAALVVLTVILLAASSIFARRNTQKQDKTLPA